MASIFTQIIQGDIPSHKLFEDEHSFAFLDIDPLAEGHTLVVSKREVESFDQLSETEFTALMATVHKVANRLKEVYKPTRVVEMALGFDVAHTHIHVVPMNSMGELRDAINRHGDSDFEPDHQALEVVAKKLRF